jgi:predicted RNA-binding protein (TIGR00451 family)
VLLARSCATAAVRELLTCVSRTGHGNSRLSVRPWALACLARADPDILPKYQVDRGAVPFVLGGANIMAPGLTSAGGMMDDVPTESVVAVMVQGKEHAIAIGVTTMSTEEIRKVNKGNAVENTHWLNDGLWTLRSVGESK